MKRFNSYTHGEGQTGIGQHVEFSIPVDVNASTVKSFLVENIRHIRVPFIREVGIGHGGHREYTRYKIVQHDYAAHDGDSGSRFIELLEVSNPPEGRSNIIIHASNTWDGAIFTEWENLDYALQAFKNHIYEITDEEKAAGIKGFKRRVDCGVLTPWFYAIDDQILFGDYAVTNGLQEDPVFQFGRKFVVFDDNDSPKIATCMGARFIKEDTEYAFHRKEKVEPYRIVYWDDGTIWNERLSSKVPQPLESDKLWVMEVIHQFKSLLTGAQTEFSIPFLDGTVFVGKIKPGRPNIHTNEGTYFVSVKLKYIRKRREGQINFNPTTDFPCVEDFITAKFKENGKEVEHVQIKSTRVLKGGKKWSGVFSI